jgi:hypothetical protein
MAGRVNGLIRFLIAATAAVVQWIFTPLGAGRASMVVR